MQALLPLAWVEHVNRRDYEGRWDVLPLRCRREHRSAHPILQSFAIQADGKWVNLPPLQNSPSLLALLAALDCPVKAVRLMRLHAGAHIRQHRDEGLSLEHGEARLHLPLHHDDEVEFRIDGRPVPMRPGELWYVNVDRPHEVRNRGSAARVNLVLDCLVNDGLRELIERSPELSHCDGAPRA